jgi:hypothetical protein
MISFQWHNSQIHYSSLCPCMGTPTCRCRHVPAAKNTRNNKRVIGGVVFSTVHVVSKESLRDYFAFSSLEKNTRSSKLNQNLCWSFANKLGVYQIKHSLNFHWTTFRKLCRVHKSYVVLLCHGWSWESHKCLRKLASWTEKCSDLFE